jgi:hypothetical protein
VFVSLRVGEYRKCRPVLAAFRGRGGHKVRAAVCQKRFWNLPMFSIDMINQQFTEFPGRHNSVPFTQQLPEKSPKTLWEGPFFIA